MCKSKWLYVFVDMDQHHDNTIIKRHSATRHDDFICSTPGSSLLAAFRWRLVPLVEFWIFQELYGYITVIHCPRIILNTLYSMDFVCTQADSMGGRSIFIRSQKESCAETSRDFLFPWQDGESLQDHVALLGSFWNHQWVNCPYCFVLFVSSNSWLYSILYYYYTILLLALVTRQD